MDFRTKNIINKMQLVQKYDELRLQGNGVPPSIGVLANAVQVSLDWASHVIAELQSKYGLVDPDLSKFQRLKGPGYYASLDSFDVAILLVLFRTNPSYTLGQFQWGLFQNTGTIATLNTIQCLWQYGFDITSMVRQQPNFVPIERFSPGNMDSAMEYIRTVLLTDPRRVKFGGRKRTKGESLAGRRVRRDPITGIVPNMPLNWNAHKGYSITGFCGVDPTSFPTFVVVHTSVKDFDFDTLVEQAIESGFLKPGDVVVMDDVRVIPAAELEDVKLTENALWNVHGIHFFWLPVRCPNLNPMGLVWMLLMQRLNSVNMYGWDTLSRQHLALNMARSISTQEVLSCYRACGYNV